MTEIKHKAFLFDATRCIDCRACMVACSVENNIEMNKTRIWVSGIGVKGTYPDLQRGTMVYHCMHCEHPDCVSGCPVGAHSKRPDGPTAYDRTRCIGCRYCMLACPFGVPHFDHDKGLVDGAFIDKCTFCPQRVDHGQEPACVQTCPTDALEYGEREELIREAHARIAAHPRRYIDHVYGEFENGGTSYLILSHIPFRELGLPELTPTPVKDISEAAVGWSLPAGAGIAVALTAATVGVHYNNQKKSSSSGKAEEQKEKPE